MTERREGLQPPGGTPTSTRPQVPRSGGAGDEGRRALRDLIDILRTPEKPLNVRRTRVLIANEYATNYQKRSRTHYSALYALPKRTLNTPPSTHNNERPTRTTYTDPPQVRRAHRAGDDRAPRRRQLQRRLGGPDGPGHGAPRGAEAPRLPVRRRGLST